MAKAHSAFYFLAKSTTDVQTLLTAVRFLIKLGTISPLADLIETQVTPPPQLTTDEELIAWVLFISGYTGQTY